MCSSGEACSLYELLKAKETIIELAADSIYECAQMRDWKGLIKTLVQRCTGLVRKSVYFLTLVADEFDRLFDVVEKKGLLRNDIFSFCDRHVSHGDPSFLRLELCG